MLRALIPMLPALIQVMVLFGGTLAVVLIDRAIRARSTIVLESFASQEPGIGVMLLLTVLCNIAALPYYFYRTRGKVLWGLLGFALFVVLFIVSVWANYVARVML